MVATAASTSVNPLFMTNSGMYENSTPDRAGNNLTRRLSSVSRAPEQGHFGPGAYVTDSQHPYSQRDSGIMSLRNEEHQSVQNKGVSDEKKTSVKSKLLKFAAYFVGVTAIVALTIVAPVFMCGAAAGAGTMWLAKKMNARSENHTIQQQQQQQQQQNMQKFDNKQLNSHYTPAVNYIPDTRSEYYAERDRGV